MPPLLICGVLERLNAGEVVIGDGGFVFALEKRGYVKAGPWTPEVTVTHPEAGAQIVGVNCHFDPMTCVKAVKLMKEGVEKSGLKAHYMVQPLAYHVPDSTYLGYTELPEFPFGTLEPRTVTRWDVHKYTREAYKAGIRFIGGCCGFEPYHIRAVAEELAAERGIMPAGSEKHGMWGAGLEMHTKPWVRARCRREYWENLLPASGRPKCASLSTPESWGVTKGHADLLQHKEATTTQEMKHALEMQKKAKSSG
uniref:Betaine-homocysteine methyltransferase n=1 Tax=Amphiprion percula TaxID=161767 RepID=A0A3P8TMB8_AMPPE